MAEQISVSRDTLRAELTELELRLVERIAQFQALMATKSEVAVLEKKVEDQDKRIQTLENIRWQVKGIIFAVGFCITTVATMSWHIWG